MTDYEINESTPTDADESTYDEIYQAVYDAVSDANSDNSNSNSSLSKSSLTNEITDDLLEFDEHTDDRMYTVYAQPQTCAEQSTMYLLEIRNLLLIFILGYFILTLFYRFKNTIFSFTR